MNVKASNFWTLNNTSEKNEIKKSNGSFWKQFTHALGIKVGTAGFKSLRAKS